MALENETLSYEVGVGAAIFGALAFLLLLGCSAYACFRERWTLEERSGSLSLNPLEWMHIRVRRTLWPIALLSMLALAGLLELQASYDPSSPLAPTLKGASLALLVLASILIVARYALGGLLFGLNRLYHSFLHADGFEVSIVYEYTYNTDLTDILSTLVSCCTPCTTVPTIQVGARPARLAPASAGNPPPCLSPSLPLPLALPRRPIRQSASLPLALPASCPPCFPRHRFPSPPAPRTLVPAIHGEGEVGKGEGEEGWRGKGERDGGETGASITDPRESTSPHIARTLACTRERATTAVPFASRSRGC
jgi:hypothetical protein